MWPAFDPIYVEGALYIRINLRLSLLLDFETLPNNCKGDRNVWIQIEEKHIPVKILSFHQLVM